MIHEITRNKSSGFRVSLNCHFSIDLNLVESEMTFTGRAFKTCSIHNTKQSAMISDDSAIPQHITSTGNACSPRAEMLGHLLVSKQQIVVADAILNH